MKFLSMVAGSPAKVVGKVEEPAPSLTMKHGKSLSFISVLRFSLSLFQLNNYFFSGVDATKKFCDFWDVDGFTEEFVDGAGV